MRVKIQVRSQKKEPWESKDGKPHLDRVLMGPDEDYMGGCALESMMLLNVPQEQNPLFEGTDLRGKVVEFGVSRLMPFGGAIKFFGRVLSIDGKPVNAVV